jgi:vancomycin resistance protein VanW
MKKVEKEIAKLLFEYENPKRVALSKRFPLIKKPIIFSRQKTRSTKNLLDLDIQYKQKKEFYKCILARHQSLLRRTLGNSSPVLQERKIKNLQQAVKRLNGITIEPNKIFSLWTVLGKPRYKDGYVDGMLLANGKVVEGLGGGLCQLSNFLCWIFMHTEIEIIERYHHSMDVFPDSGRTLPFGSGATILYNFIDFKVKNISENPIQLKIWLTDKHLKGQLLSPEKNPQKYHVFEKNHFFIKRGKQYFRYNELYRQVKVDGKVKKTEKIATNFAPTMYKVTKKYLEKNDFEVLDFTDKKL